MNSNLARLGGWRNENMTMSKLEKIAYGVGFSSMIVGGAAKILEKDNLASIAYPIAIASLTYFVCSTFYNGYKNQ